MPKLTIIVRLIFAVLFGSAGLSASADLQKGQAAYESGDYVTALSVWNLLLNRGDANVH